MRLWDGLFACDPTCELAQWVCVAMLIRIRNECDFSLFSSICAKGLLLWSVITADYSSQLLVLLHYPSSHSQVSVDGTPHHATLLG